MPVDRERIREQLRQGLGPDQIAGGDREIHHAVLEEQARFAGELGAFEPTAENVALLRDERKLRWEAIAVRLFGGARRVGEVKALYDELHGEGASRRSYTGRGRKFTGMVGGEEDELEPSTVLATESGQFGIARESSGAQERLEDLDLLRVGTTGQVREYLERHLHSDRFYVDDSRIWIELPNRADAPPDKAVLTWFRIPDAYSVAAPEAGTRAGRHAIPTKWDATLCTILLNSWNSGLRVIPAGDVTCRWCDLRLAAIELATGSPLRRMDHLDRPTWGSEVTTPDETVRRFDDRDAQYLEWVEQHPEGYVVNTDRNPRPAYLQLHVATCRHISKPRESGAYTERQYIKFCSASRRALERWAEESVGGELSTDCACLHKQSPPTRS